MLKRESARSPAGTPNLRTSPKRVGVLKGSPAKIYEAVILGSEDAPAADAVIDVSILWGASVLNAEPIFKEIWSRRCFKYQSYSNHSAKFCRIETSCG